jgi:hypothetical protein
MHALTGMWIANVEESRRDPNHQFSHATMRFEVVGDLVTLTYGGINASGRHEQERRTIDADGHSHAVPEASGIVTISTLDARELETVGLANGTEVGRARYEVSEDGRTMTATVSGIDANGKTFDQVIVFDRELAAP